MELGGALKNPLAIGAGMIEGAGFGIKHLGGLRHAGGARGSPFVCGHGRAAGDDFGLGGCR